MNETGLASWIRDNEIALRLSFYGDIWERLYAYVLQFLYVQHDRIKEARRKPLAQLDPEIQEYDRQLGLCCRILAALNDRLRALASKIRNDGASSLPLEERILFVSFNRFSNRCGDLIDETFQVARTIQKATGPMRPGSLFGDLSKLLSASPDGERLRAAERLRKNHFRRPIHSGAWKSKWAKLKIRPKEIDTIIAGSLCLLLTSSSDPGIRSREIRDYSLDELVGYPDVEKILKRVMRRLTEKGLDGGNLGRTVSLDSQLIPGDERKQPDSVRGL